MEIYKEKVFDLLTGIQIRSLREDSSGQVLVPGLKEVCVTNENEVSNFVYCTIFMLFFYL